MRKKQLSLFRLISAILLFCSISACDKIGKNIQNKNPYGLEIISSAEDYRESVKGNPDNELVEVALLDSSIALDIRYATKNNFTKDIIYTAPRAFVRKPVAKALLRIQKELNSYGLGLKIFDAYRPYAATVKFYEVYPDTLFVAAPWKGSVHNRGCAVDLILINLETGQELEMPTLFDDFTEKAAHKYMDLPESAIANRKILRDIMEKHGFSIYKAEWWHYDYKDWINYALTDIGFDEL